MSFQRRAKDMKMVIEITSWGGGVSWIFQRNSLLSRRTIIKIFIGFPEELKRFPMVYFSSKSPFSFWSQSRRKMIILVFGPSNHHYLQKIKPKSHLESSKWLHIHREVKTHRSENDLIFGLPLLPVKLTQNYPECYRTIFSNIDNLYW